MFDTHCHLQFSAFEGKVDEIVEEAFHAGITHILVPGTDIDTSKKAIDIALKYDFIYSAVGIHPHHVIEYKKENIKNKKPKKKIHYDLEVIEKLLQSKNNKIVAVGEIGLDRHVYKKTKYENYQIDDSFIALQKELFVAQLQLAKKYHKSVIIHNRETRDELLETLKEQWSHDFEGHMVFHCCEPDDLLLDFAKKHHIYIGVDGDITYRKDKQEFIKKIPPDLLVLETDAPFLLPEPFRSQKRFPNKPAYLVYIKKQIALLKGVSEKIVDDKTMENAINLFTL
ncbi:MAG TPA: TatD family hydrolase [Patescibacteria group bacterium]|nr:TatD family hydrolase [Patescibacteria group bacterium]